jgi:SAM-dependent methyltransferase
MSNPSNAYDTASANTYFVDPESPEEMARLINLDRVTTQAMGGPLSGLTEQEVAGLRNVLDLGCGPGGWVLDVAFSLPRVEVAGVDISRIMVDYANARARSQELTNASFGVMDITQPLDFSDGAFDLVNARFLVGVLRREHWAPFVAECTRLLRPGGILRLTEPVDSGTSTSPAYERFMTLFYQALWRGGYSFSPNGLTLGMTHMLPSLLRHAGYQPIRWAGHALEFSAGTPAWADFYRNIQVGYFLAQPGLVRAGLGTQEEIARLYQQMLTEMQAPDFCGMGNYLTVIGIRP